MLKILQNRLQQYVYHELPDVQAVFRKGRGARDQVANIHWIIKKSREFQKKSTSALLTMPKCWGPAPADPGYSKERWRRRIFIYLLIKDIKNNRMRIAQ